MLAHALKEDCQFLYIHSKGITNQRCQGVPDWVELAKKNHCFQCNKRLGLLPFTCKCGTNYCTRCKWPEDHHCTFDYRAEGMKKLAKENPVIVADKLTRI